MKPALLLVLAFSASSVLAQQSTHVDPANVRSQVRAYRSSHEVEIVREFAGLVSIPDVATDTPNIRRNAEQISNMLRQRGVEVRLLEAGGPPIVFGELNTPGATRTLIVYAHYDGQPVDPAQWASPPWAPTLRDGPLSPTAKTISLTDIKPPLNAEWRLFGRATGDDKLPIISVVTALDAMKAANLHPSINLRFFFEGEEERDSPHLRAAIDKYHDLLRADAWLICDGPVHPTRRMQVFFGARGETNLEMTVYGPLRPLHSGHYGNWAPNPAALLANLLAAMRDRNAHVLIPGFYDDVRPLTAAEQEAIRNMPSVDDQLKNELALAWTEGDGEPVTQRIMQPSLNIRGIEAGHVGDKATNSISTEARSSIDFRLVPDMNGEHVHQVVERFIEQQGFYIVHQDADAATRRAHPRVIKLEWGESYVPAARTNMDTPVARAVVRSIEETLGAQIVKAPMLGGTLPMYLFLDVLKTPVIGVPLANHDNNQHAANENVRLQNLWDGIEIFAGIFATADQNWPKP